MPSNHPFLSSSNIAVFGVSLKRETFAEAVYIKLKEEGYKAVAIHPENGGHWFPDLDSVPDEIGGAYIATGKKNSENIIDDVIKAGIKRVWLQNGAYDQKLVKKCRDAGLETYTGCIMMYMPNAGFFHAFHRFLHELVKGKP